MENNKSNWLKWVLEIQAIAQNGLAYCGNEFDRERYIRLREISAEMASMNSQYSFHDINEIFSLERGYATPKLDVRAFILRDKKLLLVQERADSLWTLPGGWVDVNESPSESVIRETREETGFNISVIRLLALWDKQKHDHPPQWPHAYKFFFHCEIISGEPKENLEISKIDFFDVKELPQLSTHRVTKKQLERLYEIIFSPEKTLFD